MGGSECETAYTLANHLSITGHSTMGKHQITLLSDHSMTNIDKMDLQWQKHQCEPKQHGNIWLHFRAKMLKKTRGKVSKQDLTYQWVIGLMSIYSP